MMNNSQEQKLIAESVLSKESRQKNTSKQEKLDFIVENGWQPYPSNQSNSKFSFYCSKDNPEIGITLDVAYEVEFQKHEDEKRKNESKEGRAIIHCNKCGADCQKFATNVNKEKFSVGYYGLIDAEVRGGYESTELSDCVEYKFSLCEKCIKELFDSFKNPPKIYVYM